MTDQVIKKYKGEWKAQRGIDQMARRGCEVDQTSTRKSWWNWKTGVFTREQIHTIVFKRADGAAPAPGGVALPPARPRLARRSCE